MKVPGNVSLVKVKTLKIFNTVCKVDTEENIKLRVQYSTRVKFYLASLQHWVRWIGGNIQGTFQSVGCSSGGGGGGGWGYSGVGVAC